MLLFEMLHFHLNHYHVREEMVSLVPEAVRLALSLMDYHSQGWYEALEYAIERMIRISLRFPSITFSSSLA